MDLSQTIASCAVAAVIMLAIGAVVAQCVSLANVREALPLTTEEADDLAARQWLRDYFDMRTGLI